MKFHGKKLTTCNVEYVVIPRPDGDIPFICKAVLDFDEFEKLCPFPKPPTRKIKGGIEMPNFEDPGYKAQIKDRGQLKLYFTILKSLRDTEGLEWETVELSNPKTWKNIEVELKESGFNQYEVEHIITGVLTANCLDERMMERARENFMTELEARNASTSQQEEAQSS